MRKIVSYILVIFLIGYSFVSLEELVIAKDANQCYVLEKELEKTDEKYDVQVYGSCHSYHTVDAGYLTNEKGISTYNKANPSEIMPVTYLRIKEQLKEYKPKVILVEVWGISPYDTYLKAESIMGKYLHPNLELIPLSLDKIEVINDFEEMDMLEDNIHILRYKDRLVNLEISSADYDYSFEKLREIYDPTKKNKHYKLIDNRLSNNGFFSTPTNDVTEEYLEKQAVNNGEELEIEANIFKYIEKIIDLCEKEGVKLIFFRAPYVSNEVELSRINYLNNYLDKRNVDFYDLEELIDYDYENDFYDIWHLSQTGATKTTDYLYDIIKDYI